MTDAEGRVNCRPIESGRRFSARPYKAPPRVDGSKIVGHLWDGPVAGTTLPVPIKNGKPPASMNVPWVREYPDGTNLGVQNALYVLQKYDLEKATYVYIPR